MDHQIDRKNDKNPLLAQRRDTSGMETRRKDFRDRDAQDFVGIAALFFD
jgi:hypothetical protein